VRGRYQSFNDWLRDCGRLTTREEPARSGPRQRDATEDEEEVQDRHVTQVAEVVVIRRRDDHVGARDAEERTEQGERARGGSGQGAADAAGGTRRSQGAEIACALAGISPTVLARIASARRAPAVVAMAMGIANDALSRCVSIVMTTACSRDRSTLKTGDRLPESLNPDAVLESDLNASTRLTHAMAAEQEEVIALLEWLHAATRSIVHSVRFASSSRRWRRSSSSTRRSAVRGFAGTCVEQTFISAERHHALPGRARRVALLCDFALSDAEVDARALEAGPNEVGIPLGARPGRRGGVTTPSRVPSLRHRAGGTGTSSC
jgi:hypothetical protein